MKIKTNLFAPDVKAGGRRAVLEHVRNRRATIHTALAGILRQHNVLRRAGNPVSIAEIAAAIDSITEETVYDGRPLLDGRYGRGSLQASLWFNATPYREDPSRRHYMYIPTMTARSLSLVHPNGQPRTETESAATMRWAWRFAEKAAADLRAYAQRLRLVERRLRRSIATEAAPTSSKFYREPVALQNDMLQHYRDDLEHLEDVLLHIRVSIHRVRKANGDLYRYQLGQVEVSQWIEEIDRLADESPFNHRNLLNGTYAVDSRLASMWFVGKRGDDARRLYFPDLRAEALGLKNAAGSMVTVSAAEFLPETQTKLRAALDKVRRARRGTGSNGSHASKV